MKLKSYIAAVAVAAFGCTASAQAAVPESSDPIKLAINEWTGQHISTHVAGEILKRMGYNIEYVTAGYYPQMQAMEPLVTAVNLCGFVQVGRNPGKGREVDDRGKT